MTSNSQVEQSTRSWIESQRHIWETSLQAMSQMARGDWGSSTIGGFNWSGLIDTWEATVQQALDAQTSGLQMFVNSLASGGNTPGEFRGQMQALQQVSASWTDVQRQIWQAWFTLARQLAAPPRDDQQSPAADQPMEIWQGMVRPAIAAQTDWLRAWSRLIGGASSAG
jgi:hypothetical protein